MESIKKEIKKLKESFKNDWLKIIIAAGAFLCIFTLTATLDMDRDFKNQTWESNLMYVGLAIVASLIFTILNIIVNAISALILHDKAP